MGKFNKADYDQEYHKKHLQQLRLNLNKEHDADIIEHLETVGNKQGYIKSLIRQDIKKQGK